MKSTSDSQHDSPKNELLMCWVAPRKQRVAQFDAKLEEEQEYFANFTVIFMNKKR